MIIKNRFLLYIDILGFSDLVLNHVHRVKEIYSIVNNLNVHNHGDFKTIIFSDTILVYNTHDTKTNKNKELVVMYMIEFVQDLLFKGSSIDLNFRAILTYGEFEHYELKNVECYYGKSLVSAYHKEKEIIGVGLFIDSDLLKYNCLYKSCKYNSELNFVFLFQTMMRIKTSKLVFPIPSELIESNYDYCWLEEEIKLLKKYYQNANHHIIPSVRAKYAQTYLFYRNLIPNLCEQLEWNNFSIDTVNAEIDWGIQKEGRIK